MKFQDVLNVQNSILKFARNVKVLKLFMRMEPAYAKIKIKYFLQMDCAYIVKCLDASHVRCQTRPNVINVQQE